MVEIVIVLEIKRKPELREVLTDSGNKYVLSLDSVVQNNIRPHCSYSDSEWEDILIQSDTRIGMNYALTYLSYGMKTEKEIRDKLHEKKISNKAIYNVIDRLKELQYIDDDKYAKEFVNTYSDSRGKLRLRKELIDKGINRLNIDEALSEITDERGNCIEVANRITKGTIPEGKDREKLIRQLLSRGYTYDIIRAAIDSIGGDVDDLSDI